MPLSRKRVLTLHKWLRLSEKANCTPEGQALSSFLEKLSAFEDSFSANMTAIEASADWLGLSAEKSLIPMPKTQISLDTLPSSTVLTKSFQTTDFQVSAKATAQAMLTAKT